MPGEPLSSIPATPVPYGLSPERYERLERLTGNEMDMCFRRRAFVLNGYLQLTADDRLLDCGCGRGFFVHLIRELSGCSIVGVERDRELIPILKAHTPDEAVQALSGDITALPFPDRTYEKVIFTEVLEHIPDDRAALREIHRVMKPGGVLALSVPNHRYPFLWDPLNWVLEALFNRPIRTGILSGIWANHERLYTAEQLSSLVREAGFEIEALDYITYYCFPVAHNLVYGIGKELLIRGWLPRSISKASDRFTYDENRGSLCNPVNLMRRIFLAIDRLNERFPPRRSSVIIAMKLRKPV